MNRHRRTSLVAVAAGVALLSAGCDTLLKRNEPGTNYGQIYVGSPRIEGRERLINDRGEQERWLRDQRDKLDSAPLNVSGAVELNSLAITAAQLGVSVDPAFKLNALNQVREAASIRQSADNERAANLLQATRRDEILAKVNKGEMNFEQAKGEFEKIGIAMPASAPTAAKTPLDAASVAARTVNNTALGEKADKITPPRTDPRRADITGTPIEEFRQRLADREVVRNEINEIRLDDLHDLNGNTLFRLTFDTTVLPQSDASAWAVVKVKIPLDLGKVADVRAQAEDQYLRNLRDSSEAAFRGIANRLADECYAKEVEAVKATKTQEDNTQAQAQAAEVLAMQALAQAEQAKTRAEQAKTPEHRAKALADQAKAREAVARAQQAYLRAQRAYVNARDDEIVIFRRAFGCGSYYVGSNARRVIERHLAAWWPYEQPEDEPRRNLMLQLDNKNPPTATKEELRLKRRTLAKWASWLGQVMDNQIATDFEGHILNCFNDLEINGQPNRRSLVPVSKTPSATASPPSFAPAAALAPASAPASSPSSISRADFSQGDGIFHFKLKDRKRVPAELGQRCGEAAVAGSDTTNIRFNALLAQNLVAAVYAATPKESVQTISEVASNRRTKELLLNVNAITGSAGIAAGLNMIRANDAFQHALRRQPLVVGFTEHGRVNKADPNTTLVFGWVLGPAYKLSDDGKTTFFRHSLAQRTVSAELSLPAWMSQVAMTIETSWIKEDGYPGRTPGGTPDSTVMTAASRVYSVPLPAQPVDALAAIEERYYLREPKVDAYQELRVIEDKPARVLITGRNLWRSTDVLIGSQRASQLAVLSDNRGVLASFEKIEPPNGAATLAGRSDIVSLSLLTSEGSVIAGQVTIAPKEGSAKPAETLKTIQGVTTRVVAGMDSKLVLSDALPAANDAAVRITAKKVDKLGLSLDKTTVIDEDRKTVIFSVARDKLPELATGDLVDAVLELHKANGRTESFELVKSGIFYESDDKTKAALSASRDGPKKPIQMTLKLPAKATQGFAGLAKGAAKADLSVRFGDKPDEQATATATCTVKANACTMSFEASDAFKARLAEKKNTEINVAATLQGKDVPEIAPKELTLK